MNPKKISKQNLIDTLREMASAIENDDSFEGSLSYQISYQIDETNSYEVQASYRIGNSQGQGGMVLIGVIE